MRAIDADALYERTAEWEAQALHMVEVTMNDEDKTEWRKWSTVFAERSAFKHDIADAPTIDPEQRWIPCSERLPENGRQVLVYARGVHYSLAKYDEMRDADGVYRKQWVTFDAWKPFYTIKEVIAWCELPQYEGRQDDKY